MAKLPICTVKKHTISQDDLREYHCDCFNTSGKTCWHIEAMLTTFRENTINPYILFFKTPASQQRITAIRSYYASRYPKNYPTVKAPQVSTAVAAVAGAGLAALASSGPMLGKVPTTTGTPGTKKGIVTEETKKCSYQDCKAHKISGSMFCAKHTPMDEVPKSKITPPAPANKSDDFGETSNRFKFIELD